MHHETQSCIRIIEIWHRALTNFILNINIYIKQMSISTAIHLRCSSLRHLNPDTQYGKVIYKYHTVYFMYLISSDWNSSVLHQWWEITIAIDACVYIISASFPNKFSEVIIVGQWGIVVWVHPSDEDCIPWSKNFQFDSLSELVDWGGTKMKRSRVEKQLVRQNIILLCFMMDLLESTSWAGVPNPPKIILIC